MGYIKFESLESQQHIFGRSNIFGRVGLPTQAQEVVEGL